MADKKITTKKEKKDRSTFMVRLISTIFLLLLLVTYCGSGIVFQEVSNVNHNGWVNTFGYISMALTIILMSYCTFEFVHVFKGYNKTYLVTFFIILNINMYLLPTTSTAYDFLFYSKLDFVNKSWWIIVLICIFVFYFLIFILFGLAVKKIDFKQIMLMFIGMSILVFAFKGFSILMLSGSGYPAGRYSAYTVLWIWLIAILSDTFAYVAGSKIGKTKLAPKISPKKTWEGAYVGLALSTLCGIIIALLLHFLANLYQPYADAIISLKKEWVQILVLIILSVCMPIISMLGDLFFSLVKRVVNVKDYSNLIPGHGGMVDRLDSFIFVSAVSFALVAFI